jgi:hypothetical protein
VEAGLFDIRGAARSVDLDIKQLNVCREDRRYQPALQEMLFVDIMGVVATPAFFVYGLKVRGNQPDKLRQLFEAALE